MMVTVLILEDEEYTLEFLELIVGKHLLVDKVIAVDNSEAAVTAARDHLPQIALLDIELGADDSFNGIQAAKIISKVSPQTICVFVTGYGKYALDSFVVHPYDYLLKPIQKEKLNDLITEIISNRINRIIDNNKVAIRVKEGTILLNPDSIACIEKSGRKTIIYTNQTTYESSYNLTKLESLLPEQFARLHNSFIINLSRIIMIKHTDSRGYQVIIEDCPITACMSRKKYDEYKHVFIPNGLLSI